MKITLEFDKNLIALAGTAHGDETWHTQVEPYKFDLLSKTQTNLTEL